MSLTQLSVLIAAGACIMGAIRWLYLETVWIKVCRAAGFSRRGPAPLVLCRIRQMFQAEEIQINQWLKGLELNLRGTDNEREAD
jgi:hypothetical protein